MTKIASKGSKKASKTSAKSRKNMTVDDLMADIMKGISSVENKEIKPVPAKEIKHTHAIVDKVLARKQSGVVIVLETKPVKGNEDQDIVTGMVFGHKCSKVKSLLLVVEALGISRKDAINAILEN